jgi:hypothetical protein
LSLSQQLNNPESLWLTAHLPHPPHPEPTKFSTPTRRLTIQSLLTREFPGKATFKNHPACDFGNHHDGSKVRPAGLAEISKTPSDQISAYGESKGKMNALTLRIGNINICPVDAVSLKLKGQTIPIVDYILAQDVTIFNYLLNKDLKHFLGTTGREKLYVLLDIVMEHSLGGTIPGRIGGQGRASQGTVRSRLREC